MTLSSAIQSELPALRSEAEGMMTLTFRAYAPTGWAVDPVDGMEKPAYADKGTTKGKIQSQAREGDTTTRFVTVGDVELPVLEAGLHIPIKKFITANALQIKAGEFGTGWEFEVVAGSGVNDVTLLGRRYLVDKIPAKSYATARRMDVVELPQEG